MAFGKYFFKKILLGYLPFALIVGAIVGACTGDWLLGGVVFGIWMVASLKEVPVFYREWKGRGLLKKAR
ncbi:MAG: hypothetical protein ACNI3A_13170 [Desulfovibrio sp.]|uniref:hypothetical protein n=1 Tax=Desulfovibrio sp. 7SRBS1 TaxID=3378064 RepID=UPI003B3FBBA8